MKKKVLILEDNIPVVRYSVLHILYDGDIEYSSIDDYVITLND